MCSCVSSKFTSAQNCVADLLFECILIRDGRAETIFSVECMLQSNVSKYYQRRTTSSSFVRIFNAVHEILR